jgi:AraC family transcriptional regulator
MYLAYRNRGQRRYGLKPVPPYVRRAWEFLFVLEGSCSLVVQEDGKKREERLVGPVLLVAGPESVHGWGGRETDVCEVLILHFDEVDVAVRSIVSNTGHRRLRFSSSEVHFLASLYDRCDEARRAIGFSAPEAKKRAGFLEPLVYGIVAQELALFFLKHVPKSELGPAPSFGKIKVEEATAWYEANLSRNPTIDDVARAVHLSSTHLRRLFHKIRGVSPQKAFTEVQFERVKWLMRDPAMTLEQVSDNSGFGSTSAFSRAFKKEFGVSPRTYRETLLKKTNRHGSHPVSAHGH